MSPPVQQQGVTMPHPYGLATLGPLLLALGCAPVAKQRSELLKAAPCCPSASALPFSVLPPDTTLELEISRESPVFHFAAGRSYFAAFHLSTSTARHLAFRVRAQGLTSITESTFCPTVLFLDEAFGTLSDTDVGIAYVMPQDAIRGYFVGAVPVPAQARHVVIYSTKALTADSVPIPRYEPMTRRFEASTIPCAPTGKLSIFLVDAALIPAD